MPWNVRIQTEDGKPHGGGDIIVPFEAIPFDERKYPLLSSVAPYYDTVFNPDQLARVVAELDMASKDPEHETKVEQWKVLRDLAIKGYTEQLYLKFIGD